MHVACKMRTYLLYVCKRLWREDRLIKSDGHNDNNDTTSHCQGQALQNDGVGALLK